MALTFVRDQLPGLDLDTLYDLTLAYSGTAARPDEIGRFLRHRYVSNDPVCLAAIAGLLLAAPDRTEELADASHRGAGGAGRVRAVRRRVAAGPAGCGRGRLRWCRARDHRCRSLPAVDRPEATAALIDELAAAASR